MYHKYFFLSLLVVGLLNASSSAQTRFEQLSAAQSFTAPSGMYAGDIDQDGDQDILAASGAHGVFIIENNGGDPIVWTPVAVDANLGASLTVYMDDVDGDGYQDILSGGWNNEQVVWYRNTGNSKNFQKKVIANGFGMPHEVMSIDLDLDGDQDVLAAGAGNNQIAWWRNNDGVGNSWTKQVVDDNFMGARSVGAGDFDQDGDLDLAGASLIGNEITIWRNDGGNPVVWTEFVLTNDFAGSHRVQIIDMDGDGLDDILGTAFGVREIAWWKNTGTIATDWIKSSIENELTGAVIGTAVDLDHDGDVDVIGTGQGGNLITWYEKNADTGEFKKRILNDSFAGPWPMCIGDFNGDQHIDFAVGGNNENEIIWFKNIQEGRLTRLMNLSTGPAGVGLFIPPDKPEPSKLILSLPYCGDPLAYSRLRDIMIGLFEVSGCAIMVPEVANSGNPDYQLDPAGVIEEYIAYANSFLNIYPDSVYLLGMECNGIPVLRHGQDLPASILGLIPFNPLVPSLMTGEYEGYPDLPVCLCSGTAHPDRAQHAEIVTRIGQTAGKAWLNDLPGTGSEVLIGDLIPEILDCMNYIDTAQGGTSGRDDRLTVDQQLRVFPNPSKGKLVVEMSHQESSVVIQLTGLANQVIWRKEVSSGEVHHELDLSQTAKGIYLLSVQTDRQKLYRKIILQ